MKKCMLCGWHEHDESMFTCPACGEGTWCPCEKCEVEGEVEPKPAEADAAPVKRGPGRPRKTS